ncbi:hypothetical protein AN477_22550 [Alicyclobacillus ferrooxydans]|uniref:DNA mismatch repair protein MutL n=2 Tax=Alicyclobacillus ferrooxydans TaxID=471514 RepID=A0A0P9GIN4_9BACL|nr:hypothetical protein AN477_22550 [Alicyclobacillus ferrooxydans]
MSEALANQIAAGEVVERPASCVKELVENSLDAGAKSIIVQLEEGGIKRIRVQDDGHGMDEDDLRLAFARHATSKVKSSRDLFRIGTLGFRGEALASISAVARVTLQSRMQTSEQGCSISVEGSAVTRPVEPVGMPVGTVIEVRDLFYNTPARLKYLRTVQTEQARCVEVVQKAALSRPDVRVRVEVDDHVVFQTAGTGNPQSVLATLYGVGEAGQFLRVEGETPDYRVTGYIGRPTQARSSRQHANLFVNQRPIRNIAVHQAVAGGYGQRLMVNKQPIYAIYIELNPTLVDVNIHPHKSEVRFSEERDLTLLIQQLVRKALDDAFLVPTARLSNTDARFSNEGPAVRDSASQQANERSAGYTSGVGAKTVQARLSGILPQARPQPQPQGQPQGQPQSRPQPQSQGQSQERPKYPSGTRPVSSEALETMYGKQQVSSQQDGLAELAAASLSKAPQSYSVGVGETAVEEVAGQNGAINAQEGTEIDTILAHRVATEAVDNADHFSATDSERTPTRDGWRLRAIGQALGMYILADDGEDLYIMDQHAAHERVLYERFTKQMEAREARSIPLLTPMTYHLSPGNAAVLTQNIEVLAEMGLLFEPFGGYSFVLRTIPLVWDGLNHEALAEDVVSSLSEDARAMDVKTALRERIIMRACKAAIKANHRLSEMEMTALIDAFSQLDDPFHCPHGRPVFIRLTNRDLEKEFRRIV